MTKRRINLALLCSLALCAAACEEGSSIAPPGSCLDESTCEAGYQCLGGLCVESQDTTEADFGTRPPDQRGARGDVSPLSDGSQGRSDDASRSDGPGGAGTSDATQGPTPEGDALDPCAGDAGCFGDPCSEGSDCYSGLCGQHMGDEVCTKTCEDECPSGWSCEQVNLGGGDTTYLCVSEVEHLCSPCIEASDCSSEASQAACVSYGEEGNFCGAQCAEDSDCPSGFDCIDAPSTRGGTSAQCVKSEGICECSSQAIALGLTTSCEVVNTHGVCPGTRSCTPEGLSVCDAPTPQEDLCNGLDDDCDGTTDSLPCNDGNPCTTDSCEGESGCVHAPAPGLGCDDGDDATSGDSCSAEGECEGEPIVCPEGPCVASATPDGEGCAVTYAEIGTPCDDADPATQGDSCSGIGECAGTPYSCNATQCEATSEVNGVDCDVTFKASGESCDDGDPATKVDTCDGQGGCQGETFGCSPTQCQASASPNGVGCDITFKAPGLPCDDGEATTKDDVCDGQGGCQGTAYTCVPDMCEANAVPNGVGCDVTFLAAQAACDDGDPTTQIDICDGQGGCAGTTYTCTPGPCEAASVPNGVDCDVTFKAAGLGCDDADPSTKNDTCDGTGSCQGTAYACTPALCQLSATPNGEGCDVTYSPVGSQCDDGDVSTAMDACDGAGGCSGTPLACTPGPCEMSSEPNGEECEVTWMPAGVSCDDGDPATKIDVCDGEGGCLGQSYTCEPTQCQAAALPNGEGCDIFAFAQGIPCDDGLSETKDDQCDGQGSCSGTLYACTPGPCELDAIPDGEGCTPIYAAAETGCDDGDNNTKLDICNGVGECSGEWYQCEPTQCEAESVPDGEGCVPIPKAPGLPCDDESYDTKGDQCNGAGLCIGTPYTCTPGPCELESWPDGVGCAPLYAGSGEPCDDGDVNTQDDRCDGAGSCLGEPYACEPTQCQISSETNGSDCDVVNEAAGTPCDDGDLATSSDQCDGQGACIGTSIQCEPGLCELSSQPNGEGCDISYSPHGAECDDGDPTTKEDMCDGIGGCAGTSYDCPISACIPEAFPNGIDCHLVFADFGTGCDDEDLSTKADRCDGEGQCVGTPYTCEVEVCQSASVPNGSGCTPTFEPAGTPCDDGNPATSNTTCNEAGDCTPEGLACGTSSCQSTFNYSGGIVSWTVPSGVNYIEIDAYGAQGSSGNTGAGGLGAHMKGGFSVSPGQVLSVLVGGVGEDNATQGHAGNSTGGGGGTFIVTGSTAMLVAGGGGGTGAVSQGLPGQTTTSGAQGLDPVVVKAGSAGPEEAPAVATTRVAAAQGF